MKFKSVMGLGLTLVMVLSSITAGFAEETADETEIYEYSEETDMENFETAEILTAETIEETETTQEETSGEPMESESEIVPEETVGGDFVVTDTENTVTYAVTGGNITIDISEGAVISCDTTVTEAVIPSSYSGTAITSIWGDAFRDCSSLKSVTIPT
ncbi:MAG: hypothetical protein LUH47_03695 [Clostridiales bacterium]|nr:hypothetical protein [Clostridiales bacterium]